MKILAAEADARWEAKPRVMEDPAASTVNRPELQQPAPALNTGGVNRDVRSEQDPDAPEQKVKNDAQKAGDPWAKARAQGPSESWQPEAWNPGAPKKK